MDVHIPRAVTIGLRMRGVDVLTAQEDGSAKLDDARLLARASALGRILVSQDDDMLREAVRLQRLDTSFVGVVYARQMRVNIGQLVEDLTLIAQVCDASEWAGRIEYLPLA
jgi:hypothetical protein